MLENKRFIFALTFLLAFASMLYEYILSHINTILFGDLTYQYLVTTSLFIFLLGLGALFFEKKLLNQKKIQLYHIEYLISFLAFLIVIIPIWASGINELLSKVLVYIFIIIIAFLSGIELPWLLGMSKNTKQTLGIDYLGMCAAGIVFVVLFLPFFGLFKAAIVTGFINLIMAIILHSHHQKNWKKRYLLTTLIPILLLVFSHNIEQWLERVYLGI